MLVVDAVEVALRDTDDDVVTLAETDVEEVALNDPDGDSVSVLEQYTYCILAL